MKVSRSLCPVTAIPRLWAGEATTGTVAWRGSNAQQRGLDLAGRQARRHWCGWISRAGIFRAGRRCSAFGDGKIAIVGGLGATQAMARHGLHAQQRRLEPAGDKLAAPGQSETEPVWEASKDCPSPFPATATPPSSAAPADNSYVWRGVGLHAEQRDWTKQGEKLIGTGAVAATGGIVDQGWSVALWRRQHADLSAGPVNNGSAGAAWAFMQQRGLDRAGRQADRHRAVGSPRTRACRSTVGDGNTAIIGRAVLTTRHAGAAWVFTRSNGVLEPAGQQAHRHRCGGRSRSR